MNVDKAKLAEIEAVCEKATPDWQNSDYEIASAYANGFIAKFKYQEDVEFACIARTALPALARQHMELLEKVERMERDEKIYHTFACYVGIYAWEDENPKDSLRKIKNLMELLVKEKKQDGNDGEFDRVTKLERIEKAAKKLISGTVDPQRHFPAIYNALAEGGGE